MLVAYGTAINQALANARTKLEDLKFCAITQSPSLPRKATSRVARQAGKGNQSRVSAP